METATRTRSKRGGATLRERRPGTWEIRVTTGFDHVKGHSTQTSFTHHGDYDSAIRRQVELVRLYGVTRASKASTVVSGVTVLELLQQFMAASHRWPETTRRSYQGHAAMLIKDRIRRARVDRLTPAAMERTLQRWARDGMTAAMLSGRYRTLHAAITWAVRSRLLGEDPLAALRAPSGPPPRQCVRPGEVRRLMDVADARVRTAADSVGASPHRRRLHLALFRAEQDALMVRLAADAALIRGELVALQTSDLHDRTLSIARSSHDGMIRPLTNHRRATLTVGTHTAGCWAAHVQRWREVRGHGPWLFATTPDRTVPLTPSGLGQRFTKLARLAGLPEASLHRLRHTVGTYLVAEGKILQASKRLRNRDVSTTYRQYRHAVPVDDHSVADHLAHLYGLDRTHV